MFKNIYFKGKFAVKTYLFTIHWVQLIKTTGETISTVSFTKFLTLILVLHFLPVLFFRIWFVPDAAKDDSDSIY